MRRSALATPRREDLLASSTQTGYPNTSRRGRKKTTRTGFMKETIGPFVVLLTTTLVMVSYECARRSEEQMIPDSTQFTPLVREVVQRIEAGRDGRTPFTLYLNVSSTPGAQEAGPEIQRALEKKTGLVFSKKVKTGAVPVNSGQPGGHVHMITYALEPLPDIILDVSEIGGHLCIAARAPEGDPLLPPSSWLWILNAP
jgi:hypothetical protein